MQFNHVGKKRVCSCSRSSFTAFGESVNDGPVAYNIWLYFVVATSVELVHLLQKPFRFIC